MKNAIAWIIAAVAVVIVSNVVTGLFVRQDVDQLKNEIQELKKIADLVEQYDSTHSARDSVYIDSLKAVRSLVVQTQRTHADELKRLRRQNSELQKSFDAIVLHDRPEF